MSNWDLVLVLWRRRSLGLPILSYVYILVCVVDMRILFVVTSLVDDRIIPSLLLILLLLLLLSQVVFPSLSLFLLVHLLIIVVISCSTILEHFWMLNHEQILEHSICFVGVEDGNDIVDDHHTEQKDYDRVKFACLIVGVLCILLAGVVAESGPVKEDEH